MREKILPYIRRFQSFYKYYYIGANRIIFIEDNAGAHRSTETHEAYAACGVCRMYHPSSSPDLNPIEHVWKLLKDRVRVRKPRTQADLRQYIQEEWDKITMEDIRRITSSMQRRCKAVIEAEGGPTHY